MPLDYRFTCRLEHGLHARPASHLAELAGRFLAQSTIENVRTGAVADAASVLELVGAGLLHNDACLLRVSGADELATYQALVQFIAEVLPKCDAPLAAAPVSRSQRLPRLLANEPCACLRGVPASAGIGLGQLVVCGGMQLPPDLPQHHAGDSAAELARWRQARGAVATELEQRLQHAAGAVEQSISRAHLAMLLDPALDRRVQDSIEVQGSSAVKAVSAAIAHFSTALAATGSALLRERVIDLQDIGVQLLERLLGISLVSELHLLLQPAIVLAPNLSPRQLLELDRKQLRGLILTDAGTTSHAVILARAFGIPLITGVPEARSIPPGQELALDANRGLVLHPLTPAIRRFYEREIQRDMHLAKLQAVSGARPGMTADGVRIEMSANIASAAEAEQAVALGAEGSGLFRTELLFAQCSQEPDEEEQYNNYVQTVQAMQGRTVIFRTLDVGGDKPLPYLALPKEDNPFLGYRGLRMYQQHPRLLTAQLRALLRASSAGPVWIMAPMVSTVAEARWFKARVEEEHASLMAQGVALPPVPPVGIMLEIPAVAAVIDQLSAVLDFFSIGTNDLCQYFFAVDRGNQLVAGLYNVRHPAFLRLLHQLVESAHAHGKWIGMCGEMARNPEHAPLLVGLRLNELSLSAADIPAVKARVSQLDSLQCRALLDTAMDCEDAVDVERLLAANAPMPVCLPVLDSGLIQLNSTSSSKPDVIKEIADLLYATGRTGSADDLEDAIWAREETFSTGLGYGFAIPHCKSDTLSVNTMAILKLNEPVEWGAQDELPVGCIIFLGIRAADADNTHMKIFSRLARKLMHEEFRSALLNAVSAAEINDFLHSELEM